MTLSLNLYYFQYGAVMCCHADRATCDVKYSKTQEKLKVGLVIFKGANVIKLFMHQ